MNPAHWPDLADPYADPLQCLREFLPYAFDRREIIAFAKLLAPCLDEFPAATAALARRMVEARLAELQAAGYAISAEQAS